MAFSILGINGSLTPRSRTRTVLEYALDAARASDASVVTELLELRDLAIDFCDGRPADQYSRDTQHALALVESADAYLVASPVYRGAYTGAIKNFFDLIPHDPHGAAPLRGKVVGLLATGGSDHHFLVIEHQLRPLIGFFNASTLARSIYATPKDFNEQKLPHGKIVDELNRLGQEIVIFAQLLRETTLEAQY